MNNEETKESNGEKMVPLYRDGISSSTLQEQLPVFLWGH